MADQYAINTLHRGRYMLSFFSLLILAGGISALIPASEIVKIVVVLFFIPLILFLSVKASQSPSFWQVDNDQLSIHFSSKTYRFPKHEIDHIRALTRSGGTLYVIYLKKRSPQRFWRNKLFQNEDDQLILQQQLSTNQYEFYKF